MIVGASNVAVVLAFRSSVAHVISASVPAVNVIVAAVESKWISEVAPIVVNSISFNTSLVFSLIPNKDVSGHSSVMPSDVNTVVDGVSIVIAPVALTSKAEQLISVSFVL